MYVRTHARCMNAWRSWIVHKQTDEVSWDVLKGSHIPPQLWAWFHTDDRAVHAHCLLASGTKPTQPLHSWTPVTFQERISPCTVTDRHHLCFSVKKISNWCHRSKKGGVFLSSSDWNPFILSVSIVLIVCFSRRFLNFFCCCHYTIINGLSQSVECSCPELKTEEIIVVIYDSFSLCRSDLSICLSSIYRLKAWPSPK